MIVEFSIVPLGKGESLSGDIARVIRIVEKSGLPYKINPMGTVVEGKWDEVMELLKKCHRAVLKDGMRVVTSIKIDDRKGKKNRIDVKVKSVEQKLRKTLRK
jgi:uncharacterized protein (TIGR00106 family)